MFEWNAITALEDMVAEEATIAEDDTENHCDPFHTLKTDDEEL